MALHVDTTPSANWLICISSLIVVDGSWAVVDRPAMIKAKAAIQYHTLREDETIVETAKMFAEVDLQLGCGGQYFACLN